MFKSKICLCLSGATIAENLAIVEKYRNWTDLVELRVDYLTKDERIHVRKFPELAGLPCILTIRRKTDGGLFIEGEAARTILFARALAFASQDTRKNFAYIDLEDDFYVPSLQEASRAFGTRVIRSKHSMTEPVRDIAAEVEKLCKTGFEIAKIAFQPKTLSDLTNLFKESKKVKDSDTILIAMGTLGLPSRILASQLNSFLTYSTPAETAHNTGSLGHIDPITLNNTYNFCSIDENTALFGITGYPMHQTSSPAIHNQGYRNIGLNAVYIPIQSKSIEDTLQFAEAIGIKGLSVTVPHKESVLPFLQQISSDAGEVGACNTIVYRDNAWFGYNTDTDGLQKALQEFLGVKNLFWKKISIIGAGGAARAAAFVIKQMHGKACIFNRTISKAKNLAEHYGFRWASLDPSNHYLLSEYSDLIIQTTSTGMGIEEKDTEKDPLLFYDFTGKEKVYDVIYYPEKTALLLRAEKAGCEICNGYTMLKYQAYKQFSILTGVDYESK